MPDSDWRIYYGVCLHTSKKNTGLVLKLLGAKTHIQICADPKEGIRFALVTETLSLFTPSVLG